MSVIRVLTADDHPLILGGLAALIDTQPDMSVVAEAPDGAAAVAAYHQHHPDVAVLDLRMPVLDGVEAIRAIRRGDVTARVIALTTYDGDADIRRALDAGAVGFLLKHMLRTAVRDAIRAAHRGERVVPPVVAERLAAHGPPARLTEREVDVLRFVARGMSNGDVARAIGRSEATVKVHVEHILAKLGAGDRTEAVTVALRRGILHLD